MNQKLAEEVQNGKGLQQDLVLMAMVLGNSFLFLLLHFSTYIVWMVLLPMKGALLLTKEKH